MLCVHMCVCQHACLLTKNVIRQLTQKIHVQCMYSTTVLLEYNVFYMFASFSGFQLNSHFILIQQSCYAQNSSCNNELSMVALHTNILLRSEYNETDFHPN